MFINSVYIIYPSSYNGDDDGGYDDINGVPI